MFVSKTLKFLETFLALFYNLVATLQTKNQFKIFMKIIIILFSIIAPLIALSQKTITGKVFDLTTNQPLASASVSADGKNTGVTTGSDGTFTLKINNNVKSIVISNVGYKSGSIKVYDSVTDYSIGLYLLVNDLEQITVIGSRNLAGTNVQTPVPIVVIQVAKMAKESGQTDLNQLLTYSAPSFQSARQTVSDGTDHIDPA